jgi:hypothetical protein
MKAKKATPSLNAHNQRLFVAWSASALYEMFELQQKAALDKGIIARCVTARSLINLAQRCHDMVRPDLASVDTVDKAKKMQAKLKAQFTTDPFFFTRAIPSGAPTFSVADRLATLQAKPAVAAEKSALEMRPLTGLEATQAKAMLKKHLNLIGRGFVDQVVQSGMLEYSGVRNASIKLGNTEKDTLTARAMMLRLEGAGYDRIIDGEAHVRYHHTADGKLNIIFSRAGIFVRAFLG